MTSTVVSEGERMGNERVPKTGFGDVGRRKRYRSIGSYTGGAVPTRRTDEAAGVFSEDDAFHQGESDLRGNIQCGNFCTPECRKQHD